MWLLRVIRRPLAQIHQRRATFEACLMLMTFLAGLSGAVFPEARSRSLVYTLPGWAQGVYYVLLLVGGAIGLFGLCSDKPVRGLLIERASLLMLAGATSCFGLSGLSYAGVSAVPSALMLIGFTVATLSRAWQIAGELVAIRLQIAALAKALP
jgi:hypothetical protein